MRRTIQLPDGVSTPAMLSINGGSNSTITTFITANYDKLFEQAKWVISGSSYSLTIGPKDLLNEIVCKLIEQERAGKVFSERGLLTYVRKSMTNFIVDIARSSREQAKYCLLSKKSEFVPDANVEEEEPKGMRRDAFAAMLRIEHSLAILTDEERTMFKLRYLNGCVLMGWEKQWSVRRISEFTNRSQSSLHNTLERAKSKIRRAL